MKNLNLILLPLVLVLFCIACGAPTEQIQNAQKAMDQAKEQRAEEFAPSEWATAKQAWDQAQSALARKDYGGANTLLLKAKSRFEKARDIAQGRREELLKEVTNLQKTIDIRYTGVKTAMQTAKLPAKKKQEILDSFKDIDQSIEKLKSQIGAGDLAPAKYTAQTTIRAVYDAEKAVRGN